MYKKILYSTAHLIRYCAYILKKKVGFSDVFNRRRVTLSTNIYNYFDGTIQFGPFKGMALNLQSSWGRGDKASMILGLYEREILYDLSSKPKKYNTFVDVGAADGYYAVGALKSNLFDRTYCFEVNKIGRDIIWKTAFLNDVSDRISIFGQADSMFTELLPKSCLDKSVLLIDIEGGEFDLLTEAMLNKLKDSIIYIELHEGLVPDGNILKDKLFTRSSKTHNIVEFTTGPRDLSQISFLKNFNDNDRWLICSEGRPYRMSWVKLTPKSLIF